MWRISLPTKRKEKAEQKHHLEIPLNIKGWHSLVCFQNPDSKTCTHTFVNENHACHHLPCSSVLLHSTIDRSRLIEQREERTKSTSKYLFSFLGRRLEILLHYLMVSSDDNPNCSFAHFQFAFPFSTERRKLSKLLFRKYKIWEQTHPSKAGEYWNPQLPAGTATA